MIINLENLTKSKEAPKWHWLISDPMGALGYTISFLPQNIDLLDLLIHTFKNRHTYLLCTGLNVHCVVICDLLFSPMKVGLLGHYRVQTK